MRYGSVCSGIEAASVAWHPIGWEPAWFCEIDPFCSELLAHRFPSVKNYGDFTQLLDPTHPIRSDRIDLLVGGTPCQDFSIAGLRSGIEGERGSLTLDFCRLVGILRPEWVVWENVPGVLSSDGGRAMGSFLGALAELGYGFAWRVLDAQYFGLAQRRKRVFVVACAGGNAHRAATVLFEPEGVRRNTPPSREKGKEIASDARKSIGKSEPMTFQPRLARNGRGNLEHTAPTLNGASSGSTSDSRPCVIVPSEPMSFSPQIQGTHRTIITDKPGRTRALTATHTLAVMFKPSHYTRAKDGAPSEISPPLSADADKGDQDPLILSFDARQSNVCIYGDKSGSLDTKGHSIGIAHTLTCHQAKGGDPTSDNYVVSDIQVRRLTPRECERLQGFPDDWTQVPYKGKDAPDTQRYRALGNSMAVAVMRWIGKRIVSMD